MRDSLWAAVLLFSRCVLASPQLCPWDGIHLEDSELPFYWRTAAGLCHIRAASGEDAEACPPEKMRSRNCGAPKYAHDGFAVRLRHLPPTNASYAQELRDRLRGRSLIWMGDSVSANLVGSLVERAREVGVTVERGDAAGIPTDDSRPREPAEGVLHAVNIYGAEVVELYEPAMARNRSNWRAFADMVRARSLANPRRVARRFPHTCSLDDAVMSPDNRRQEVRRPPRAAQRQLGRAERRPPLPRARPRGPEAR